MSGILPLAPCWSPLFSTPFVNRTAPARKTKTPCRPPTANHLPDHPASRRVFRLFADTTAVALFRAVQTALLNDEQLQDSEQTGGADSVTSRVRVSNPQDENGSLR